MFERPLASLDAREPCSIKKSRGLESAHPGICIHILAVTNWLCNSGMDLTPLSLSL